MGIRVPDPGRGCIIISVKTKNKNKNSIRKCKKGYYQAEFELDIIVDDARSYIVLYLHSNNKNLNGNQWMTG